MVPHRLSTEAKLKCREVEFRALNQQKLTHPARVGDVMPAAPPRQLFQVEAYHSRTFRLFLDGLSRRRLSLLPEKRSLLADLWWRSCCCVH